MKNWRGKRAILYTRVSTTDQKDNGYSLFEQKDFLEKFCDKNDISVIKTLEEDFSGKTLDRPKINELRSLLAKNTVDLILFHKWDRFSRNISEALLEIKMIQNKGIEINSVFEYIDFSIPQQDIMLYLYLGMGEVENKIRSQRTKNGIIGALKEGRHVNKGPIGYLNGRDPINPQKPLIKLNPDKAPIINKIFQEYATGLYSQETLRKKYYHLGIKISKSQFSNMLSNPIYAGKIIVPEHNGTPQEMVEGLHEAIISLITFYKVQQVKNGKANIRISTKQDNKHDEELPLRGGILSCGKCGSNLTGSRSKSRNGNYHYYYHCNSRKGCNERFPAYLANDKLSNKLSSLQPRKEVLDLFSEILLESTKNLKQERKSTFKKLDSELVKIKSKKDKLTEKFIEDKVDEDSYNRIIKNYNDEIQDLEIQKTEAPNIDNDIDKYVEFGVFFLSSPQYFYNKAKTNIKRQIIGSIFSGKLVFEKNKYRTAEFNETTALIFNNSNELEEKSHKKRHAISNVSYSVAGTGLEPVTFGL
ncbi:recombinase family protein [Aquimarina agarilytica]|uniref:recombinase family protein n=1 Tax=Aquimarina agarilytica TaxID=1087449 RepID=UPI000288146D